MRVVRVRNWNFWRWWVVRRWEVRRRASGKLYFGLPRKLLVLQRGDLWYWVLHRRRMRMIHRELPLILIMHRWRMVGSMARSRSMMHAVHRRLHHWILPESFWDRMRPLPDALPLHPIHHRSRRMLLELSVCLPIHMVWLLKLVVHLSVRGHWLLKRRIHLTGTRQRHPISGSIHLREHPLLTQNLTHHPSRQIHISLHPAHRMTHRAIPRYRIPHPIEWRYLAPMRRYLDNTVNPRRSHRRWQQSPLPRDCSRKFPVQPPYRSQSFSTHWRKMVVFVVLEMNVTLSNRPYQLHLRIYIERGIPDI